MDVAALSPQRARVAVSAVFFVDGAALGGYVSHLADFQHRFELTNGQLGRCLLFSALGAVTTMPLSGTLIHRFGSRYVSLFGGAILLLAVVLLSHAPSVPIFCATLYLLGASNGQCDVGMNAHSMVVQDRFPRPILSAVHGWFSLGGFAGGAGAALAAKAGLAMSQHLLYASLVLALVLAFGVSGMFPASVDQDAEGPQFVLPKGSVFVLGLMVLFAFVSEGALWDWCSVYLREVLKGSAELGAWGFGIASFAMAAGRFLGDGMIHRGGYRRVLLGSSLLSGGGLLIAVTVGSIPLAIAGFAIAGLGLANMVPILFRAAASVPGVSAGMGLAAVTTCGYTGFLAGPPVVGFIADHRSLGFSLGLMALLCLVVALASRWSTREIDAPATESAAEPTA